MQKDDNCPITRSRLNHVTSSSFALLGEIMTLWTLMGNFLFVDPYIKWRVTQVCIYSLIKHHISPGTSCQLSYTLSVQLSQRNFVRDISEIMHQWECAIVRNWPITRLLGLIHRNRQGNVQTRTFEPNNESEDCWSAAHSYNFVIRVK